MYPFFTLLASLNSSSLQLHLLEGGLHADINGDGVLDHVQVHTSDTAAAFDSLAFLWVFNSYDHTFSVSTLDCRRQCWRENCSERINGSVEALLGSGNLRRSGSRTAFQRLDLPSLPFQLHALRRVFTKLCSDKRHLYSGDRNSHSYPQRRRT